MIFNILYLSYYYYYLIKSKKEKIEKKTYKKINKTKQNYIIRLVQFFPYRYNKN